MNKNRFEEITGKVSQSSAAKYLLCTLEGRTPREILERYMGEKRNGYDEAEFNRLFNADNVKRWLDGSSVSREKAFEISIYFGLDLCETEEFVCVYCGCNWLYLRSYADLVYFFFIENLPTFGKSGKENVEECRNVIFEFEREYNRTFMKRYNIEPYEMSAPRSKRLKFEASLNPIFSGETSVVNMLMTKLGRCVSVADLRKFLHENAQSFGRFNCTAYGVLVSEMNLNRESHCKRTGERKTIYELVDEMYIDFKMPKGRKIRNIGRYYNLLHELTVLNPERVGLEESLHGKKPVTRKQLIMLFLLNECEGNRNRDFLDSRMQFIDRCERMDEMLKKCKMPILDVRRPFDWLVLNAVAQVSDKEAKNDIWYVKRLFSYDFFEELLEMMDKL